MWQHECMMSKIRNSIFNYDISRGALKYENGAYVPTIKRKHGTFGRFCLKKGGFFGSELPKIGGHSM